MSKRNLILLGILVLLAVGGVTAYFVLGSKSSSGSAQERGLTLPQVSGEKKEEVKAETLYEDSAGFSFKHPKDVKVTDVTPEEDEYYTVLNLTKGSDKMVITVKDTSSKTSDDWVKADTVYTGASLAGASTLGGVSAKQYSKNGTLLTVAVDAGVVYLIAGPKDAGYWEDVQSAVISSFKFATASASGGSQVTTSDVEYEAEEVVE